MLSMALANNVDVYNGTVFARQFCNQSKYILEQNIMLDKFCDRVKDICVRNYDPVKDAFQVL